MMNLSRNFRRKMIFAQKEKWDKWAFSLLQDCDFILDVGCGEGRFISRDPSKIIGIDWNSKSIQKCREHGYSVIAGDVRKLPFEDNSVPAIHCSHVIEHFLPTDAHKILSEFNRVLRSGGIMIIRTPLLWYGFYSDFTHIRPYNPEAIVHYLTLSELPEQHALEHISSDFKLMYLKWRYAPIPAKNKYLDSLFKVLNLWGFPWLKKNGYMLVMKKMS